MKSEEQRMGGMAKRSAAMRCEKGFSHQRTGGMAKRSAAMLRATSA